MSPGSELWQGSAHSDRLPLLACLRAALEAGAEAANYMEATALLHHGARVLGARVTETTTGQTAEIRAAVTLPCTGVGTAGLAAPLVGPQGSGRFPAFARAMNVVIDRPFGPCALGAISRSHSDAVVDRGGRMYFLVPWEGKLVIGAHELPHEAGRWDPDPLHVGVDARTLPDEVNHACPALALRPEEVILSY